MEWPPPGPLGRGSLKIQAWTSHDSLTFSLSKVIISATLAQHRQKDSKIKKSVKSPLGQDWGACLRSGYGLVRAWSGPFRSGLELTDHMDGQNVKKSILGESRFPLHFPFDSHHFGKLWAKIEKSREFRKIVKGLSSMGPAWSAHPWWAHAWKCHLRPPWEAGH